MTSLRGASADNAGVVPLQLLGAILGPGANRYAPQLGRQDLEMGVPGRERSGALIVLLGWNDLGQHHAGATGAWGELPAQPSGRPAIGQPVVLEQLRRVELDDRAGRDVLIGHSEWGRSALDWRSSVGDR